MFSLRLVEGVLELGASVGGIHVDQERADPGGRHLQQHLVGVVRRPDADAIPARHTERQQALATASTAASRTRKAVSLADGIARGACARIALRSTRVCST